MSYGNFTLYGSDSSGGGSTATLNYVEDVFKDISLVATNNTGLTDTAATNPTGLLMANNDAPRYGAKTLLIKDLVLIEDRTKWISNKPTYRVIWHEHFPAIEAFVYGKFTILRDGPFRVCVQIDQEGDGIGVTGVLRRLNWIVQGSPQDPATAQMSTDGVSTSTINFSRTDFKYDNVLNSQQNFLSVFETVKGDLNNLGVYQAQSSNETNDLHTFQLTAIEKQTLRFVGVIGYFENATNNIQFAPGTTYVNKSEVETTSGAAVALPSLGSSLGGKSVLYKAADGTYGVTSIAATMLQTVGVGSSGTNLVNVSLGTGGSFPAGSGVVVPAVAGASLFYGIVQSVSTDVLTIAPTLPFGVSGVLYTAFHSGPTYVISPTLFVKTHDLGASTIMSVRDGFLTNLHFTAYYDGAEARARISYRGPDFTGASIPLWDAFSRNHGLRLRYTGGISAMIRVEGYFSALEMEFAAASFASGATRLFTGTFSINGVPAFSLNEGFTGIRRVPIMTDAGPGWNTVLLEIGNSMSPFLALTNVALYERAAPIAPTFGRLAELDTLQAQVQTPASQYSSALGTFKRYFAEEVLLQSATLSLVPPFAAAWQYADQTADIGGYISAHTFGCFQFSYFGKDFTIVGTSLSGASVLVTLDGASVFSDFNLVHSVPTEGFHTIGWTLMTPGSSAAFFGIDVFRTRGELVSTQNDLPRLDYLTKNYIPEIPRNEIRLYGITTLGTTYGNVAYYPLVLTNLGSSIECINDPGYGSFFRVLESGMYTVDVFWASAGTGAVGMVLNPTDLATPGDVLSNGAGSLVGFGFGFPSNPYVPLTATKNFNRGDVVCVMIENGGAGPQDGSGNVLYSFSIRKVENLLPTNKQQRLG